MNFYVDVNFETFQQHLYIFNASYVNSSNFLNIKTILFQQYEKYYATFGFLSQQRGSL